MNSETNPDNDASYRYWKAAISCLSTPAKREVAEEFLRIRLEGGSGTDTLFALILLLEANGAFLQSIPQRYDGELLQPLGDLLNNFRSEFQTQAERQRQTSRAIILAQDEIGHAATSIGEVSAGFERKLHAAILGIDMKEVATRLSDTLDHAALKPVETVLRNLENSRSKMEQATASAQTSVETWRKVHFGGLLANCLVIAGLVALILSGVAYWQCKRHFDQRLAAEIVRMDSNYGAINELLGFGIDIRVAAWTDANGKPVHDGYLLTLSNAVDARIKKTNDTTEANILVKQETPQEQKERTEKDRQEAVLKQSKKSAHTR
jgi:hypothetical protein